MNDYRAPHLPTYKSLTSLVATASPRKMRTVKRKLSLDSCQSQFAARQAQNTKGRRVISVA
jgi:hypothetical protein